MENKPLNYFSRIMPITKEEADAISATMVIKHYKKGDILLKEGQISTEAYFVLEGCVRQYYIVDGEERTANFFTEEQWVISLNSFSNNLPSNHYMACSTDCFLVVGNREKEEDLYGRFPKLETVARKVMEKNFVEQQEIMASYTTDSPEQRYIKLFNSRPELFKTIPQYQIASYIGVKPESLSRIRKRIIAKR
ncbi:Crp/Fnr family transcriptional regulator [Flavobacterium soyangense]|uniref:Crp/Fnr family transcriptional regulator n=1 Tax=Flavobacterium soyangense TaxID=2023265 RepID=A0A930U864_9FLAO|nr:Crp/Fnr family transcriptional regulator [Flavobacterium soyangense]MBF2708688.1 Crp/Fnr family transcriptional regulator [Flavobacterium soyangense]